MELPITNKELDLILKLLKNVKPSLYAKLWCHKINNKTDKK